jgi:hypothetical protein
MEKLLETKTTVNLARDSRSQISLLPVHDQSVMQTFLEAQTPARDPLPDALYTE